MLRDISQPEHSFRYGLVEDKCQPQYAYWLYAFIKKGFSYLVFTLPCFIIRAGGLITRGRGKKFLKNL